MARKIKEPRQLAFDEIVSAAMRFHIPCDFEIEMKYASIYRP